MNNGIPSFARIVTAQAVAASTALVTIGASGTGNIPFQFGTTASPMAAGAKLHITLRLVFSLGATGGFKFQIVPPATPGNFTMSGYVEDVTTPAAFQVVQNPTAAAFANASAVAGNYYANLEVDYTNGATPGTVAVQFACNSAANAITMLPGSWMMAVLGN
jgi:hypothetical protein